MKDYYALMVTRSGSPEVFSPTVTDQDAHTAALAEQRQSQERTTSEHHAHDLTLHMNALTKAAAQAALKTPSDSSNIQPHPPDQNEAA